MTKRVPLGRYQQFYAIVDDEDYEAVMSLSWVAALDRNTHYAFCDTPGQFKSLSMHKFITGFEQTDHRNGNGLDNRRDNLRAATNSQNMWNRSKQGIHAGKPTLSKFKGVTFVNGGTRRRDKWTARIQKDGKSYYLGGYASEEEAAKAYDAEAVKLFGEFARPNFP